MKFRIILETNLKEEMKAAISRNHGDAETSPLHDPKEMPGMNWCFD